MRAIGRICDVPETFGISGDSGSQHERYPADLGRSGYPGSPRGNSLASHKGGGLRRRGAAVSQRRRQLFRSGHRPKTGSEIRGPRRPVCGPTGELAIAPKASGFRYFSYNSLSGGGTSRCRVFQRRRWPPCRGRRPKTGSEIRGHRRAGRGRGLGGDFGAAGRLSISPGDSGEFRESGNSNFGISSTNNMDGSLQPRGAACFDVAVGRFVLGIGRKSGAAGAGSRAEV